MKEKDFHADVRERFNVAVEEQYKNFIADFLAMEKEEIIKHSWELAKAEAIKDFLVTVDDDYVENLFDDADSILTDLYEFELNYDMAQWTNHEDIFEMACAFADEYLSDTKK